MNLGIALNILGSRDEGRISLERAADLKPTLAQAHYNLAMAEIDAGDRNAARERLQRAVRLSPKSINMHTSLGSLLMQMDETEAGLQHFRRAVSLSPKSAVAHNNLGSAIQHTGDHENAITHFRKAQELDPEDVESIMNIANSLAVQRKTDAAIKMYEEVIKKRPDYVGGYNNYGLALRYQGRFDEAISAFKRALEIAQPDSRVTSNLAETLSQSGRGEDALAALQSQMEAAPDNGTINQIGATLTGLGRFEEAAELLNDSLDHNPDNMLALTALADLGNHTLTEGQQARLEEAAAPEAPNNEKVVASLALARWHDRRGETDQASRYLESTVDVRRTKSLFDLDAYGHEIDRTIATFDDAFFANRLDFGSESDVPIFVVGLPRSGATIIERILSAHPQAHGAGELTDLFRIAQQLPHLMETETLFPKCTTDLNAVQARELADQLVRRRQSLAPDVSRIADKSPAYGQVLGLAKLLTPNAHIVYCQRDPMDQCLSLYFHDLAGKYPYSSSLESLGEYSRIYRRMMDHWMARMDIHSVAYEDLVSNPERVARGIIEACGLPWDAKCLAFQTADGIAVSASPWRIRQPIDTSSVGRWKQYETLLAPLRATLGQ
jgi:tetratricopeptide (TPR) repeat protein